MKHITIICLSMIILICCLTPVISAEINEVSNNAADLNVNNTLDLNSQNNYCKKYPRFDIFFVDNPEGTYSQNDDIYFEITFDSNFHGPLDIYLDKGYITTVYPDYENVVIGFVNYHLPPGKHLIEGEFKGDENFYIEYFAKDFYIN